MPPHDVKLLKEEEEDENHATTFLVTRTKTETSCHDPPPVANKNECCIHMPPFLQQLFGFDVPKDNAVLAAPNDDGNDEIRVSLLVLDDKDDDVLHKADDSTQGTTVTPQAVLVDNFVREEDEDSALSLVLTDQEEELEPRRKRKSALKRLKHRLGSRVKKERRGSQRRGRFHSQDVGGANRGRIDSTESNGLPPLRPRSLSEPQQGGMILVQGDDNSKEFENENNNSLTTPHPSSLAEYKQVLKSILLDTQQISAQTEEIWTRLSQTRQNVQQLELSLTKSLESLDKNQALIRKDDLQITQNDELARLSQQHAQLEQDLNSVAAGWSCDAPTPKKRTLRTCSSMPLPGETVVAASRQTSCFMRIHDLDLPDTTSSSSSSFSSVNDPTEKLFWLDNDLKAVLQALAKLGYDMVTDESSRRFKPTRDTEKILSKKRNKDKWHAAVGKEILVWSGGRGISSGFGCDIPVLKARGIIEASPRTVLNMILDNARVQEYNKMSLGRTTVQTLQEPVDTPMEQSEWGLPGTIKITKSLNKPPLIRKNIEMLSLLYAQPLESGAFLMTSRSVWEDSEPTLEGSQKNSLRSEMLLGVTYLRPLAGQEYCEMTTITHVYSPSVPEMLAKSFAPTAAANFIRDVQAVFAKK